MVNGISMHCRTIDGLVHVAKRIGVDKASKTRRGWAGQAQEQILWEPAEHPMPLPVCIKVTINLSNLMDNLTKLRCIELAPS